MAESDYVRKVDHVYEATGWVRMAEYALERGDLDGFRVFLSWAAVEAERAWKEAGSPPPPYKVMELTEADAVAIGLATID